VYFQQIFFEYEDPRKVGSFVLCSLPKVVDFK